MKVQKYPTREGLIFNNELKIDATRCLGARIAVGIVTSYGLDDQGVRV
jgi:hypothetical protein